MHLLVNLYIDEFFHLIPFHQPFWQLEQPTGLNTKHTSIEKTQLYQNHQTQTNYFSRMHKQIQDEINLKSISKLVLVLPLL